MGAKRWGMSVCVHLEKFFLVLAAFYVNVLVEEDYLTQQRISEYQKQHRIKLICLDLKKKKC